MGLKRRTGTKNPPIFSTEFLIQNHADIVSCIAMLFVVGLLIQVSAPIASMFVVMHHNVTAASGPNDIVLYTYGYQDICVVIFYSLITIVMHAILQEYVLDKLNRKLHLSKMKHSKFNESGQLLIFYVVSLVWGCDIILRSKEGNFLILSKLWRDYPHNEMPFMFKFYFIVQLAYWVHCYPELFFQKVKKDEMKPRIIYTTLYLAFLASAYVLNFTRIAICLSVLHYFVESIFHASRLLYFADREKAAKYGFAVWNVLFVLVRLFTITLSTLTFWYGLSRQESGAATSLAGMIATGNFNCRAVRINALAAVCLLQAWMMWNFITFHLRRARELASAKKKQIAKKEQRKQKKEEQAKKASGEDDVNELPEVDQNSKLRARPTAKAKH